MKSIKSQLSAKFNMKDLGELSFFVGIDFEVNPDSITMSQSRYLTNMLKKYNFEKCKPRKTPCETNPNAYNDNQGESNEEDTKLYRQMVGSLIYAMTCTRPDLSYCITKLSQHLSNPTPGDWIMLKHVFRYVKGTVDYKLKFHKSKKGLRLNAFSDADWASSTDDRRSITGYCTNLNEHGPIKSWKSKKQPSVALSTCEAITWQCRSRSKKPFS
eukprot:TCONS_00072274-protein